MCKETLDTYLSAARSQRGKQAARATPEWPDARIATVARLWAEGCTAAQIAAEIGGGITRSAVIGKVHRLGLPARERGVRTKAARAAIITPPPAQAVKRPAEKAAPVVVARPAPVPALAPPVDCGETALVASILDLVEGQCRWPLAAGFCGRPSAGGKSYCAHHALRSVNPRGPMRPPRAISEGRKSEPRERIADCIEMFEAAR
ncbi:GcrA cell cycle regulator [Methylosinus trichosporium OB3b]|uniref:GcrA cell cycle regulator n=2 Tax=Methylocystaceae TaxID=31993 RepID=A0A2D2D5M8_METT3|nr:GcrA cell cycle regulator [Methylosinus trichosporium OB3b]